MQPSLLFHRRLSLRFVFMWGEACLISKLSIPTPTKMLITVSAKQTPSPLPYSAHGRGQKEKKGSAIQWFIQTPGHGRVSLMYSQVTSTTTYPCSRRAPQTKKLARNMPMGVV
ncbi:hypothetical protein J3459_014908 [Metarhizium acridum]|uniref:uncharacterized protein n=1 Tax=Metarhizium acridum TaxID=92637 RepID=UPI001C6C51C7|nr:hypothetical protein J3459_014908 [Metarhizium acridum]KAG8419297.1 hypothetical protein J3458_004178 [Metarhizium acridum]